MEKYFLKIVVVLECLSLNKSDAIIQRYWRADILSWLYFNMFHSYV